VQFASLAENSLGTENATNISMVLKMELKFCYLDQIDTTRCEVLTAVYILMMVFLDMTRCSLRDNRFRRNVLLTFSWQETTIMKMEAAGSFDTFVPICQIIKRHISEDPELELHSSFPGLCFMLRDT
jgi:hypothetical protein